MFVIGEYNWGMQPGLKNLTDHFLEEWFWRPAAIASYSAGKLSGARASVMWHGTLSEMGMVVVSSTLAVGPIGETLDADAQADRCAWGNAAAGVSPLCRRSGVVDRGRQNATLPQAAPILKGPFPKVRLSEVAVRDGVRAAGRPSTADVGI